jgi:hypothetical protein
MAACAYTAAGRSNRTIKTDETNETNGVAAVREANPLIAPSIKRCPGDTVSAGTAEHGH